jgi:hypothetical protein
VHWLGVDQYQTVARGHGLWIKSRASGCIINIKYFPIEAIQKTSSAHNLFIIQSQPKSSPPQ